MNLTTERKQEIFELHGKAKSKTDTGSAESQIALFTERINHISGHLKINKKDFSAEKSLIQLVGKRRALLNYLMRKDVFRYRDVLKDLNIRK